MSEIHERLSATIPGAFATTALRRWRQVRDGLCGSRLNTVITLVTLVFLLWTIPVIFNWALFNAVFAGTSIDCKAAEGACWAFIAAKLRFILFAFFPAELQWRPALAVVAIFGLLGFSASPRFWSIRLVWLWVATLLLCWALMTGGWFSPRVSSNQWGGLPVTLLLWLTCFATSLPIAVLLALARRSKMGLIRVLSIIYIELMRAIPMVAILYVAMLILPMALPGGEQLDKIWRAALLIALFWSAYAAEVIRGGLQAISHGQYEAATALGLTTAQSMRLVVLLQAIRIVIPGLVNLAVGFLLATSLVTVIGIFDLLNAAKASATDPSWLGYYDEAYILVAVFFFTVSSIFSSYGRWLERQRPSPKTK